MMSATMPARSGNLFLKRVFLTVLLCAPFVLVAGLMYWFSATLDTGPRMKVAPVGAGAGSTGGANAIGEMLAGNKSNRAVDPGAAPAALASGPVQPETLQDGIILIVEDKSKKASQSRPIYFAGNLNNWNPGDKGFRLDPQSDMRWRIQFSKAQLEKLKGARLEFKFTLGAWEEVEQDATGGDIGNRTLAAIDAAKVPKGEPLKIELAIDSFKQDQAKLVDTEQALVVTGTVKRLQVKGGGGSASGLTRDCLVWLPPGYEAPENATRTYPVLYLLDGQNIFTAPPGTPGEWGADETATALIKNGKVRPLIIVGIPHAGVLRTEEYVPPVTTEPLIGGKVPAGESTVAWIRHEVMPRVERAFRVSGGPANTGIGGASLGGLMALYAGAAHAETFGLVLAESPSLGWEKMDDTQSFFGQFKTWPSKVFLAVGGNEAGEGKSEQSKVYASRVQGMKVLLEGAGLGADRLRYVFEPQASHNEAAWANRLPGALEFLYPQK
jgi:pullulanase